MLLTTPSSQTIMQDPHFPALRDYIISSTGLCYYDNRPDALSTHVADRLSKHGMSGCHEYLRLLQNGPAGDEELDHLVELLTIGETYFFRHRQVFDGLRDKALPEIAERNRGTRRLRIWSAGCSIGAEPYSLSILIRRDLGHLFHGWNVSILGTDINRRFLAQAAEGRFEEWAFRGTTDDFRQECFTRGERSWQILPQYKEGVTFQYHNLVRHPFPSLVHNLSAFDLILCRNVLIYFSEETVQQIMGQFIDCLVPHGWLTLGHAEHNAPLLTDLEAIGCQGGFLYRKLSGTAPAAAVPESKTQCVWQTAPRPEQRDAFHVPCTTLPAPISLMPASNATKSPLPPTTAKRSAKSVSSALAQIRARADAGRVEEGLKLCKTLIRKHPLDPALHFYQALLLDHTSNHETAILSLRRAIYIDRNYFLAHYCLGLTYQKLEETNFAVRAFRNALWLVSHRDPAEAVPDADGMTISDIRELSEMHLEVLTKR
jgi:chemotaxis protein methyltransferase CheR